MWYWWILWKSAEQVQISLKTDKNIGRFTWKLEFHCRWRQKFATKALLSNNQYFYAADSGTQHHNTHRMHSSVSIAKMVMWTRHIVGLYLHCLFCWESALIIQGDSLARGPKLLSIKNYVNQLTDDELTTGYYQQDGATCHTSNASMRGIESFFFQTE